jgi:hypothetical protein
MSTVEKNELSRTKVIKIKTDEFCFDIGKVSVDDYLAIEDLKIRIAPNYIGIARSPLTGAFMAANIIDMVSVFRILMPTIEDSVPEQNFGKLCFLDTKELLEVYTKEFSPWYNTWMKEFNSPFMPEEDKEGEDDKE